MTGAPQLRLDYPHRTERLDLWMRDNQLDCAIAVGALNVNYLAGYWRYYNLPAAVVLRRDGHRTLLVTREELEVANASPERRGSGPSTGSVVSRQGSPSA